eukprot:TRINITY_DN21111_c0_g1_i1.p1 TRINITY_DN21111_c0_g1~~TRINITY_DN21111_c0_g1_i1.p1  ORF type:complete len:225 (+),score=44.33 TRINITY_DN21111_c0_g1_i1:54-728(+)
MAAAKKPAETELEGAIKRAKTDGEDDVDDAQQRSVFVSGLPRNATKETLEELFADVGKIVSHDIAVRSGGTISFVEFETADIARDAIKVSGNYIDGSKVNIQTKRSQGGAAAKVGKQKSNTIFVKFLDGVNMTTAEVTEVFNLCGGIKDLRMHNSRQYCFVEFHKIEAATTATHMNDPRFQIHYSQQSTSNKKPQTPVRAKVEASKAKPASIFKPRAVVKKKAT